MIRGHSILLLLTIKSYRTWLLYDIFKKRTSPGCQEQTDEEIGRGDIFVEEDGGGQGAYGKGWSEGEEG
jgi:hypothetical protein